MVAKAAAMGWRPTLPAKSRVSVMKTYKLYIDGKFPRSESGRTYQVLDSTGQFLANAAKASRKDARDAVVAARRGQAGWAAATAYNRAQVLYRVAEMIEGRRAQLEQDCRRAEGLTAAAATKLVDATIDRWVWYAGWADKYQQVVGGANPVAGPYFNLSTPEPTGVVAAFAPEDSSLLGLVNALAPIITTGNTAIVVSSYRRPLPAITLAEVIATSDVPAGVVNLLTGDATEIGPWLAEHADVNALDLDGLDHDYATDLQVRAAGTLKRCYVRDTKDDDFAEPTLDRLTSFIETKTVWHPIGT